MADGSRLDGDVIYLRGHVSRTSVVEFPPLPFRVQLSS